MKRLLRLLAAGCAAALASLAVAGAATAPYDPFFAGATTAADFGATARPFGIAAGDVDNDGKVDIVSGRAML